MQKKMIKKLLRVVVSFLISSSLAREGRQSLGQWYYSDHHTETQSYIHPCCYFLTIDVADFDQTAACKFWMIPVASLALACFFWQLPPCYHNLLRFRILSGIFGIWNILMKFFNPFMVNLMLGRIKERSDIFQTGIIAEEFQWCKQTNLIERTSN